MDTVTVNNKTLPRLVGFRGYARAGKNAAANGLLPFGYKQLAFADTLRDVAYAIDPYVLAPGRSQLHPAYARLSTIVRYYGWDIAKTEFKDVRRLLQRLGTEAGRDILGQDIWVNTTLTNAPDGPVCITDVRFPNEQQAIKSRGGITVKVDRPGVTAQSDHPSETSLDDIPADIVLVNDDTIAQLHITLIDALEHYVEYNLQSR